MDLDTFNWLLSDPGQTLLALAMAGDVSEAAQLHELTRLRRLATPEHAAAAYEIAVLRRRAAAKFTGADTMYFTREALEQASGERIAAYRAERYQQRGAIADLCCGIGGDTLALARVAPVAAVDHDPLRLAMAAANARACGLADRASFTEADLEQSPPPAAEAIFFDPARRSGGKRVFALADYRPPMALVQQWRTRTPAIGVKVAPGVSDEDLAPLGELEVEFISVDGELKEAMLWFGPFATPGRRATVLVSEQNKEQRTENQEPQNQEPRTKNQEPQNRRTENGHPAGSSENQEPRTGTRRVNQEPQNRRTAEPRVDAAMVSMRYEQFSIFNFQFSISPPPLELPAGFLYEPDPAILRAHLVVPLAIQLGAAQIDHEIAYLTADHAVETPFARCWRVLEWLPFNLKRLRVRLRALDAGAITVKKRGSPLDTDALARQLSSDGARPLVVVLTRVADRPAVVICEGPISVKG